MRVAITSRHFKVPDNIKAMIEEEFDRFKKYTNNIMSAEVILEENNQRKSSEIKMKLNRSLITVSDEDYDLIKAIENSMRKMERRIKRYVGKHHRRRKV
jgi:putative sigma-54 modulation protein